jgi:hypothetical protein
MPSKLPDALTAEEFDAIVDATCKRWSSSSINVMRHLLVEQMNTTEAAARANLSKHRTNILASRFAAKIREYRLLKFKNKIPPMTQTLTEYRREIEALLRDGYTRQQIVLYLSDNGCKTTVGKLNEFLKDIEA